MKISKNLKQPKLISVPVLLHRMTVMQAVQAHKAFSFWAKKVSD